MNKQKGSAEFFFGIVFTTVVGLLIAVACWDVSRFIAVANADTQYEIDKACEKYKSSTFANTPTKCLVPAIINYAEAN